MARFRDQRHAARADSAVQADRPCVPRESSLMVVVTCLGTWKADNAGAPPIPPKRGTEGPRPPVRCVRLLVEAGCSPAPGPAGQQTADPFRYATARIAATYSPRKPSAAYRAWPARHSGGALAAVNCS